MAEKTVPWWRRALQFALGGIRSGFGLFQRGAKQGEAEESEPTREVEAVEAEAAIGSEKIERAAAAQEISIKSPVQNERKHEAEDLAVEAPRSGAVNKMGTEIASDAPTSDPASERIEAAENESVEAGISGTRPVTEEPLHFVERPVSEEKGEEENIQDAPISGNRFEVEEIAEEPVETEIRIQPDVDQDAAIEEPLRGLLAEELETVDSEATMEAVEADAPSEENLGEVKAVEVPANESVATAQRPDTEVMAAEELAIAEAEEPVIAEVVSEESTGPHDDRIDDLVGAEPAPIEAQRVEETASENEVEAQAANSIEELTETNALAEVEYVEKDASEVGVEARAAELHEELIDEPLLMEPQFVEDQGSNDLPITHVAEVAEATNEEPVDGEAQVAKGQVSEEIVAAQTAEAKEELSEEPVLTEPNDVVEAKNEQVISAHAEPAEAHTAEEMSAEAPPEKQEGEPAGEKDPGHEVETDIEEETSQAVPESVAAIDGAEAEAGAEAGAMTVMAVTEVPLAVGSEVVAAPAQLELIPKPQIDEKAAAKLAEQQRRRKEAEAESPFSVMVGQVYDGPLDLLLDLIRKQDIDIYDIPIAKITAQFLAYVNQLKASDVDVAGEFIYTASLLIHIKSKMLLPRTAEAPGEAAEDPRRELVERLLEHERFKNAAQMLQQKQMMEAASWSNPGYREFVDDEGAEPEIAADTVDLVKVFREILERARNRPVLDVAEDTVTVGQMIRFLGRRLMMEDKPIALRKLLSHTRSERALIAMFLALLELVRLQAVLLRQDKAFSEIFIKKHAAFETVMDEGLANARDDWR